MDKFTDVILNRRPMISDHRDYRLVDFLTIAMIKRAAQIDKMEWEVKRILDQGKTGHCVGYAFAGFGISLPVFDDWNNDMGEKIYYAAKIIDWEPNQEDGSNSRSGVQAFTQFSNLSNYAFATSIDDIIVWLLTTGPIVGGTNWYDDMFSPDSDGLVKIGGSIAGGHEWMISGYDKTTRRFLCTNSWGDSFGIGGQFYIGYDDYLRLFNEQGDAVTAVEVGIIPAPITPAPAPIPAPSSGPGCMPDGLRKNIIRILGGLL